MESLRDRVDPLVTLFGSTKFKVRQVLECSPGSVLKRRLLNIDIRWSLFSTEN